MWRWHWTTLVGLWLFCALSSQALGQTLSFLDESGAPASIYAEGSRVTVQVTDPAANVSPGKDTVQVRLSTALGGDVELITLTETGTSTGIFRGDVALAQKGGVLQPGVLETDTLREPPYGRDTISADYDSGAATGTASLAGSILKLLDRYGRPATRFAMGETILIRAIMPLRNQSPAFQEQVAFHLTAGNGSDDEWVYLTETGWDTGVFEGSFPATGNPPLQRNGVLETAPGQVVEATLQDFDLPTSLQADATMAASSVELTDAQGKLATFYLESTRAYVSVFDTAANLNPSVRDTTTVQMTADLSGDQETITLQETGPSTGIFAGSIPLRHGASWLGNGTLETIASSSAPYRFDTIRAIHTDGTGSSTDAVDTIGSITSFRDAYGNEVTSYAAGARVYLQVEDHNADNPGFFDTVSAFLQSPAFVDSEGITLVETGRNTGIFGGSIPTATSAGGSGDGVLTVQTGETILARHVDTNNVLASGAQAAIQSFDIRFIEATGEPTQVLVEDGTARVRVIGPAANANPNLAETVTVHLQTLYSQDQEDLTLTETGPDTGVFEGSIRLNYATNGTPYNLMLDTGRNGNAPFQSDEVTATFGDAGATAHLVGSRVWFIDDYGRITTSFPVGANVGVRVEKPALNNPGQWDQIYSFEIDVRDGNVTNFYYLNLNETGPDTGIFEGTIPSSAVYSGYFVIRGAPGLTMQAISWGAFSSDLATASAVFTGGQVLFVDAQGQAASVYMEGTRAYVRVIDHQRAGTVAVALTSEVTGDQETLTLVETSAGSGIFEGSIGFFKSGAGLPGNGVLETGEQSSPVHVFDTLHASYTDSAGGANSATVTTLGYRVWFLDAYGNVVTSYPQGSRVYVRIEWHNFLNPNAVESLSIRLQSATGDLEYLQATETGRDSGVFEASIPLDSSGAVSTGDGRLQAPSGAWISADRNAFVPMPVFAQVASASVQFIDDAGRPTAEVLAYGTARVRLVSPADNRSSTAVDIVIVQVSSRYSLDVESVTLTETGPDTGVFEGSVPLVFAQSNAIPYDGQLETAYSGDYPPKPEEVTVAFGGFRSTATVIGSRVVFIDDFGRETTTFPVGANVGVRLIEPSSNHALVIETVYSLEIGVTYDAGLGSTGTTFRYLDLNETGVDTGVFEGRLPSSASGSGWNVIPASPGRLLTATHFSQYSPVVGTAHATFTGGQVRFVDDQGQPASVYLEGTRAYLRVEDHLSAGPRSVQVTAEISGDQETVTLQETSAGSGIFLGSIELSLSNVGSPGNGKLETGESLGPPFQYETIHASYTDSTSASSTATATTLGYRVWFLDASGTVVNSYLQGTRAYVRLEDHNYNHPNSIDILYVQLNSSSGDQEFLQVTETGIATGIYEGTIPLDVGAVAVGDGRLQAPPGGEITADRQGAWFPAPVHAHIDAAAVEFIDETGAKTVEILENGTARVRVLSLQDNLNPAAADSIVVQLHSRYGNDQENLTLTETGPDTGIFEGAIRLLFNAPPANGNGTLETRPSPGYTTDEITATYGIYSATAHDVLQQLAFLNQRGQVVSSYPVRSRLNVRVVDAVDNNPSQVDSFAVTLQSLGMDVENVWVTETGPDTGVFLGSISSTEQPGGYPYDGIITAPAGQQLAIQSQTVYGYGPAVQATITNFVAPQTQDDSAEVAAGSQVAIDVLANDVSTSGPLSVAQYTQPEHGSVTIDSQGIATVTAASGYTGSDFFTYLAVDPQGGEALGYVILTITPANRPPVAVDDTVTVDEDSSIDVPVLANDSDPDGDILSVESITQPAHGTAIQNGNNVTYVPNSDYHGADSLTYVVGDGHLTATATVSITVGSVNDAPVAIDDSATVAEDGTVNIAVLANDTDVDGDTLSVASVTQGAHGAVVINPDKTVKYTPAANYNGSDSFTYTVSDGNGGTATGTVTITVTPVNDVPVANADSATVTEDGTVNVSVLGNDTDPDGDTLSVASVTQGAHGAVVINPDKTVKYTPVANYNGSDSFTYTVSDGNGGTATATVTVTVTAVNDAPVANADSATVAEDGTVNVSVLGNDTDPDGDTLSVASVTQGAHGAVVINPDKTVKYTPAANYNGSDSFTYTVSDGNGGTATATVTVTVTAVNDAPVANADSAIVAEDGTVNVVVLGNDTDVDGDTLSVSSVTQGAHGAVVINPDKTVKYTPAANYNGS
ncbi:MAG: Ig-like domain-containing protein, partial [Thermoanaerobaculia bacterium]